MSETEKDESSLAVLAKGASQLDGDVGRDDKSMERTAASVAGNEAAPGPRNAPEDSTFDDARSTAHVLKLYEAVLKEPIPDEMLRLVQQLSEQADEK